MQNIDLATLVIIASTVIVTLIGFKDRSFFEKYKFNIAGLKKGEKVRLFSSGFLHADVNHLLFNMLTLYFFAPVVVSYLSTTLFVCIYVAALLAGSWLSFIFHKQEPYYSAIGAHPWPRRATSTRIEPRGQWRPSCSGHSAPKCMSPQLASHRMHEVT